MSLSLLDEIAGRVAQRPGALGLLALGSAGARTDRRDEQSDLDFFVITQDKPAMLADLWWLSEVQWSHRNTPDGYRALVGDVLCEFAVFTPEETDDVRGTAGRWVWRAEDCPEIALRAPEPASAQWFVDEILSDLYVGLHRWLRGERLAAMRVVQVEALAHLLRLQALRHAAEDVDPFDPTRRAEMWDLPLNRLDPGIREHPAGGRDHGLPARSGCQCHARCGGVAAATGLGKGRHGERTRGLAQELDDVQGPRRRLSTIGSIGWS